MSLSLPADHWAPAALERLDGIAEVGPWGSWGFRTPSRSQVLAAFEVVEARADSESVRDLARAYGERFREEFSSVTSDSSESTARWVGGHVDARAGRRSGALRTGSGYLDHPTFRDPEPAGEPVHVFGEVGGALEVGRVAFAGRIGTDANTTPRVTELYGAASLRSLELWVGRRAPAFGAGMSGTIVLDGLVPLDGGGAGLAAPVRLPWILEHLGPIRFETHLARLAASGEIGSPWFWAARGSLAPHPRVGLGLNRAAIFGGDGSPPVNLRNVGLMILGTRPDEDFSDELSRTFFSNQVLSVDLRLRANVAAAPISLYLEWGMEDGSGAWKNVPGIVGGVHVPFLPRLPELSLGVERTHFARSCCGNPAWYRHAHFSGGWADDGVPLGHSLGGHGGEWLLHGRADLGSAALRSSWRLFHRERGAENLYAPDREGTSLGVALQLEGRLRPGLDLVVDGSYERGGGADRWEDTRAFLGIRTYF